MPSIPQSYKAAVISEKGAKFEIKDIDYKKPEEGHITIKVLASGVCHSDSIVVDQLMPTGLPRVPGHEIVGRVVEVPESEKRWKKKNINGVVTDGGHSEYATIRREAVLAIPEGIEPAKAAPLLCAGVTVYNSIRHMDLMAGDVVAIQGLGGLGHLGVQIAAQMGMKVVALSGSDSKRKLATELGAHVYVDGTPNGELMSKAINGLAVNGTLLILGVGDKVEVPIMPMIGNRLQIRAWPAGTAADSEDTIRFAMTTGVETRIETYPLDKIQDAYDSMMNNKARFRSVIVFDE
ncbi:hypothetical protein B0A53_05803 [Rhodotorula sp. CCFEE 5036]|nr:hypothetical protein B0A53_05803 [Rhodotorula sp. CCFEE 5036]